MKKCTKIILGTAIVAAAGLVVTAGYISYIKKQPVNLPADFTITAHTGCEGTADNSLEAIEKGYLSGADIVEFDVHFDSKGEPVLAHDYAADDSVKLCEVCRNGPVERYVGEGSLSTPTGRRIHTEDKGLDTLLYLIVREVIYLNEGS